MDEKTRILNMVSEGKLTAEEATRLLDALGGTAPKAEEIVLKDKRGRKPTKLHVNIDTGEKSKNARVNIKIPLTLIRTLGPILSKSMPKEAKDELDKNGIDLQTIINSIDSLLEENSEEDIVNINVEGEDAAKVRIYVE